MNLTAEILDEILEQAGLYLDGDRDDPDRVGFRREYSGRGYGPQGFGFTADGSSALPRLLVAAGLVAGRRELEGEASFDAMRFAQATCVDSMGLGTIYYWPGWEVTGELRDENLKD